MNIGSIIAWLTGNMGFVTQVITAIETVAGDLQKLHGNNSLDAYAKAVLAAIESFFSGLGATTLPTPAEKQTINDGVGSVVTTAPAASEGTGA
jgi:hypothetical protein